MQVLSGPSAIANSVHFSTQPETAADLPQDARSITALLQSLQRKRGVFFCHFFAILDWIHKVSYVSSSG